MFPALQMALPQQALDTKIYFSENYFVFVFKSKDEQNIDSFLRVVLNTVCNFI